jgi:hypothetical protein
VTDEPDIARAPVRFAGLPQSETVSHAYEARLA